MCDIAGSGAVHLVGGASGMSLGVVFVHLFSKLMCLNETTFPAYTAAKMMGPRLGRFDIEGDPPMGSPTNAVIGLFMLWWGWLAFNAGSTFGET